MSIGIYKCLWVFIYVHRYINVYGCLLYTHGYLLKLCPWVFINIHGYLKMLVGIYQSELGYLSYKKGLATAGAGIHVPTL